MSENETTTEQAEEDSADRHDVALSLSEQIERSYRGKPGGVAAAQPAATGPAPDIEEG